MEQVVRERRIDERGVELPIECHRIVSKGYGAFNPHYHEYIEFIYADEDCCVDAWVAGKTVNFKKGEMIIINSNAAHTFFNVNSPSKYICVKVKPDIIYSFDSFYYDFKYVMPFFENNITSYQHFSADALENSEVPSAFAELLREQSERAYGYEISIKSFALRIFLWVVRYLYEHEEKAEVISKNSYENVRLIQKSAEYINSNYADINESQAAEKVNMSYSHYSRQFKKVMGKSFCEYLNMTRINAAERQLLTTTLSVTEIAQNTGFSTSSHFIENFRKLKGMPPAKYRQIWMKQGNSKSKS